MSKLGTLRKLSVKDLATIVCQLEIIFPDLDIQMIHKPESAIPVTIKITSELNTFGVDDLRDICRFVKSRDLSGSVSVENSVLTFNIY